MKTDRHKDELLSHCATVGAIGLHELARSCARGEERMTSSYIGVIARSRKNKLLLYSRVSLGLTTGVLVFIAHAHSVSYVVMLSPFRAVA